LHIEHVRLADKRVAIEDRFEPPPLARLASEDRVSVAASLR